MDPQDTDLSSEMTKDTEVKKYLRNDAIIAIGGGSVIDTAKLIIANLISEEILVDIYHQIFNLLIHILIRFNQICPKWIKMDQNGSNLIKLDFSPIKKCYIL